MLLAVIAGSETFSPQNGGQLYAGTVKVNQFFRRAAINLDTSFQMAWRDPTNAVMEIGRSDKVQASQQNTNHGVWVLGRYDVPEGSYITLQIQRKIGRELAYSTGMFVLFMRAEAALHRLSIPFTGNPLATLPCGIIEGRFDLVSPDDFATLNFRVKDIDIRKYDEDPADYFDNIIVETETRARPTVSRETIETPKGQVIVNRTPSRRLIKLNRKT